MSKRNPAVVAAEADSGVSMYQSRQPLSCFLFWILLGVHLVSMPTHASQPPTLPTDFSQVDVYLATRDIGHEIYTKYGHTILRVVDRQQNFDISYNWGMFDFNDPNYIPKFLKGILIYRMGYGPWWQEVAISKYERQTMWMEKIQLTPRQKETLLRRIHWQAQPENIKFAYLFFYDNCSTRVRDLLDLALDGKLRQSTASAMTGATYRDRVLEYNASVPLAAMGQDIILSSEPDREMSQWDDMFIPIKLREYLLRFPAYDDDGQEIPGSTLLTNTQTLTSFARPEIPSLNGYMQICLIVGLPCLLGTALRWFTPLQKKGLRLMGFSALTYGMLSASFATFMALSWAFGSHTVLPGNLNLLLMWPTDILYAYVGFFLLIKSQHPSGDSKYAIFLQRYTVLHMVAAVMMIFIGGFNILPQNVDRVLVWLVPLMLFTTSTAAFPDKIFRKTA